MTLQETIALSLADLPTAIVAAFYALGAFAPKPARFDLAAALAVTGADEETLFTLADRNLVEMGADETLTLHQTLSALARTQLPAEVTSRHRDYYLALVDKDQEDWQRIETIYEQVSFAWSQLAEGAVATIEFADKVGIFQIRRGLWPDRLAWLQLAYNAVKLIGELQTEAHILNNLGFAFYNLSNMQQALHNYEKALMLRHQVNDKMGEVVTLNNIGLLYADFGEKQKALGYYKQALILSRRISDKANEAQLFNNIGRVYDDIGEKRQALVSYELALTLWRQMDDKAGEATTLNNIGCVYNALGDKKQALTFYKQALELFCVIGDKTRKAGTLNNIGGIYNDLGEKTQALVYYEQALTLYCQVENKAGEATTLNNLAILVYGEGRINEAAEHLEKVIDIFHNLGSVAEEAVVLSNLAHLWHLNGNQKEARRLIAASLAILERYRLSQDAMGETTVHKEVFLADLAADGP